VGGSTVTQPRTARGFLLAELGRHRGAAAGAVSSSFAATLLEGATMGLFALAIQALAGPEAAAGGGLGRLGEVAGEWRRQLGQDRFFLTLVGLAVATQVLRSLLRFTSDACAAALQADAEADLRRRIFRQLTAMHFGFTRRWQAGDLAHHVDEVNLFGQAIHRLNTLIDQLMLLVCYCGILLWLSWPATLVAVAIAALGSAGVRPIVRRVRESATAFKRSAVALSARTVEFLHGLRLVLTFAREEHAYRQADQAISASREATRRGLLWAATLSPVIDTIAVLGVALFLIAGYLLVGLRDAGEFARFATFVFVLYRMAPRLSTIHKTRGAINQYLPAVERIAAFLRRDDKSYPARGDRPAGRLTRGIEFRAVGLRYGADRPWAVEAVSFTLDRGATVALVGESGAGKSTLADLLLRFYDPTAGEILIDGVDLRAIDWRAWREQLGVVSQETHLLHATVRDNIAFGKPDATDEEIAAAARAAHADEFIAKLPAGYATVIQDQGHGLSGGQRQRLAIARALLRDPQVLILDEATTGLDSHSERQVREALRELTRSRTTLAIAHRLSTIADADLILVLDRGRVVERGRHDELLAAGGRYRRLWRLQTEGAEEGGAGG